MNVIITGASGFLGNTLCRLLYNSGYSVTALALDATSALSLKDLPIKKIDCNILCKQDLQKYFQDQQIVFHLAGIVSILKDRNNHMYSVNVDGTKNVAEAALAVPVERFIYVSSIHSFHRYPGNEQINENRKLALTKHEFDYDRTKALGEFAFLEVVAKGLNGIIINPTGLIGPYDFEPSLMGNTLNQYFHLKMIPIVKGGFNFLDVRDAAQTLINTIGMGNKGERFIIGGKWISIRELIDMVITLRGFSAIKIPIPNYLLYIQAYLQCVYALVFNKKIPFSNQSLGHLKFHRFIDDSKARTTLNHKNRSLMETLNDLQEWNIRRSSTSLNDFGILN